MLTQIDDYSMVRFLPFDRTDEEGVGIVLQHIDFSIQYGEDLEVKEPRVRISLLHITFLLCFFQVFQELKKKNFFR